MQEAAGASLIQDTVTHSANVAIHVLLGTAALALGVRQLAGEKGDERHRRVGRWFLACTWGAVGTAAVGILVFEFRAFLGVITLLVAYWAFAGYRTLRIRTSGPTLLDALGSLVGLGAAGLFLWHLTSAQFPWSASVIYSTLGTLVTVATYDLSRFCVSPAVVRHALALRARRQDDWGLQRHALGVRWHCARGISALQPVASFCRVHSDHDRVPAARAPHTTGRAARADAARRGLTTVTQPLTDGREEPGSPGRCIAPSRPFGS